MTGTVGSAPCGACKFLRRKCVSGCVFAPYFCHEQGAAHFAAVHKVFGASNASKLLSRLPIGLRGEAAVTISYEAQARLQDPIYGCISHIFVLEQQVVSLQTQLACLKQQTSLTNQATSSTSPNAAKFNGELFSSSSSSSTNSSSAYSSYPQDVHSWLHSGYPDIVMQQFTQNRFVDDSPLLGNHVHELETHNSYDREYSADLQEEDNGSTTTTFQCSSSSSIPPAVEPYYYGHNDYSQTWPAAYHHNMADDLHSVAFGHTQLGV